MSRNYETLDQLDISREEMAAWADRHETAFALAVAIHAIADESRTADAIWETPTPAEKDHVKMAVAEYIQHGDFDAAPFYQWGDDELDMRDVMTVELTEQGRDAVREFFDDIHGPGEYDLDIGIAEVLETLETQWCRGDDSFSHEAADRNGPPRLLYLHEGHEFTVTVL